MNTDFNMTVSVSPQIGNLKREIKYIKSALLYADNVSVISPLVQLLSDFDIQVSPFSNKSFKYSMNRLMDVFKHYNPELYNANYDSMQDLVFFVSSGLFQTRPLPERIAKTKALKDLLPELRDGAFGVLGKEDSYALQKVVDAKIIRIIKINHVLTDPDKYAIEYYQALKDNLADSYPLYDELSSKIIQSSVGINGINKDKTIQAGLSHELLTSLPSFDFASIDEILDIKKELSKYLIKFRSEVAEYAESIKSIPFDDDFEDECNLLYVKRVAPEIENIKQQIESNTILKNLIPNIATDKNVFSHLGSVVFSLSAYNISQVSEMLSKQQGILLAGSAFAASSISTAVVQKSNQHKKIASNNLYFYYKAGKLLNDLH